jgi:diadenosine tetraphosphatase ApaH/serine/threonine PP2A family protein phosphatase
VPDCGHYSTPHATATPGRFALVYAIGDIHGSLQKLRDLIARCQRHADGRAAAFVFLGDYIDRGPDSSGVVELVMQMQARSKGRVIALKGNHEAVAIDIIDGKADAANAAIWLREGGVATLRSYGVRTAHELPNEHVAWMRSLPLHHDDGCRFFVHGGIDPEKPLDAQTDHDLLWMREPFLSDPRDHRRLIVHGHTPQSTGMPDLRSNRLNLDTGAVFGGPLTAAAFGAERDPIGFLQAR